MHKRDDERRAMDEVFFRNVVWGEVPHYDVMSNELNWSCIKGTVDYGAVYEGSVRKIISVTYVHE